MRLDALLSVVEWTRHRGPVGIEIAGLAIDSRQVRQGYLFIAHKGEMTDGHLYISDALERGAAAIALTDVNASVPGAAPVVSLDPSPRNLSILADRFYGQPPCTLIGVTGTNGKTTCTYMIRHYLERTGIPTGLLGTIVYEHGARSVPASRTTPDICELYRLLHQMAGSGAQSVAMEVSSHALVQERIGELQFDVCAFTNLTRDHLDYHRSMDAYYAAKRTLFDHMRTSGADLRPAVVCVDDQWGQRLADELRARGSGVLTVSSGATPADVSVHDLEVSLNGSSFGLTWQGDDAGTVRLNALGRHNVANWLVSAAVARQCGVSLECLVADATEMPAVPGRLEFIETRRGFTVVVDYAHTDDALSNVLSCLRELVEGQLRVVFGCGGDRDRSKRARMGAVAEQLADHVVLTSDNPRTEDPAAILDDITQGMTQGAQDVIEDRRDAIARALHAAQPGDVVLIAGKGHETYQEINRVFYAFDDREVAREIIADLEA